MLTIHGRINSINVQKVVLACEELQLPYQRIDAGGAFRVGEGDQVGGTSEAVNEDLRLARGAAHEGAKAAIELFHI